MTELYPLIPKLTVDIKRYVNVYGEKPVSEIADHFLRHFPQYRGFSKFCFEEQVRRACNVNNLREGKNIIEVKKEEFDEKKSLAEYAAKMESEEKGRMETMKNFTKIDVKKLTADDVPAIKHFKEVSKMIFGLSYTIRNPRASLKDVLGLDSTIKKLRSAVRETVYKNGTKAFILCGPPGCGKSMIAEGFAMEYEAGMLKVTKRFSSLTLTKKMKLVDELFELAREYAPTVITFGDNLFSLNRSPDESLAISLKIENLLEGIKKEDEKIFLIIETDKTEDIPMNIIQFVPEIYVPCFEINGRYEFLQMECKKKSYDVSVDLKEIALRTPAYTALDLRVLVRKARGKAFLKNMTEFIKTLPPDIIGFPEDHFFNHVKYDKVNIIISEDSFSKALQDYRPILLMTGFPTVPQMSFDDIGGMEVIKEELQRLFMNPIMYPNLFANIKSLSNRPPGLLLWGPPGCGKTMLAKGMANKAGINFLSVAGAESLDMHQGESERNIRKIFNRAFQASPCIIFFDEFDAICQKRSNSNEGTSKTSLATSLLTELDGMKKREGVYVIAATNRPDTIDQAALRPGRFETILYIGLPTEAERVSTFEVCLKYYEDQLTDDICVKELARLTPNFSPADINCLCGQADEDAYIEVEPKEGEKLTTLHKISMRHFMTALTVRRPSVSMNEIKKYENLKKEYENRRVK